MIPKPIAENVISISASAAYGTPLRPTFAAHSGSTRSNAVAKITRVEDRNTEPTQPKNHSDSSVMRTNCRIGLPTRKAASVPGYGNTPIGFVPAQYALFAAL